MKKSLRAMVLSAILLIVMSATNLYELAKRQIELEFLAETQDARQRRQAKLENLEKLRPTLERAMADSPALSGETAPVVNKPTTSGLSLSRRIKDEVNGFDMEEMISMPTIYERLISKYEDVRGMKEGNVRSLIATLLKKMRDKQQVFLAIQGRANEPNFYSRKPAILVKRDDTPQLFGGHLAPPNGSFVLSDAVRNAIRGLSGATFHYKQVLAQIKKTHPGVIDKKREASVSATVSNLVNRGELEKAGFRNKKMTYRAVPNRGLE